MDRPLAFTINYHCRVNALHSRCNISHAFNPDFFPPGTQPPLGVDCDAIWDTGATNTVITKEVAEALGLKPIGTTKVSHAGGVDNTPVYLINITLPNKITITSLKVTEGKLRGTQVLIGMDIISGGDFSVSHAGGETKFSFQIPSTHDTDFVKEIKSHTPVKVTKIVGRNDPCPCGSGRKYKNCCMNKK